MKPIQLNFKPSYILTMLLILASVGACCMLIIVDLSWQLSLLISSAVIGLASYGVLQKGLLLLPWSYVALSINIKNEWRLIRKDGRHVEIIVREDSVVTPYLTVVNFESFWSRSLVILPDAVDAESYRQLRVRLRWGRNVKSISV
ncbi:MAG TPA: protein YgfX [Methylotenera sp.]|nr:protein YgfX [Methylotenera sp.]